MSRRSRSVRTGRTISANVLVVIGALLSMVGIVYLWADSAVFNSQQFAVTAVAAAKAPPVKTEISRLLVNQAVEIKPDLITIRPLLETVIETVISTPAFGRILVPAIVQVHHAVFTSQKRNLALDISDGLTIAISGLRVVNPQIADQVPANLKTGLIQVGNQGIAPDITRLLNKIHTLMLFLGLVGVVTLAAGVAISHSRRSTIIAGGISFTVAALLLFLAIGVGRQILVRQITPDSTANAVGSVFDTFSGRLSIWLWVVAVVGVMLAAAASTTVRTGGALAQVAALRRAATRLPDSRPARIGYAALGAALATALIFVPLLTLTLAARASGLLLLYLCGTELLRLSGLAATTPREQQSRTGRALALQRSLAVRLAAAGALLIAVFIGGTSLWLNRSDLLPQDVAEADGPQQCNGYVELCDRPFDTVAFAATHNSMSSANETGWYFASHVHTIPEQLDAGIRGLLIDTHYGIETKKGVLTDLSRITEPQRKELEGNLGPEAEQAVQRLQLSFGQPKPGDQTDVYLCHGFCELGATFLVDSLTDISDWLDQNPNEVIILFFEDYVSPADTEDAFIQSGLIDYVFTHEPGAAWPTLGQMIDADKRVVVLSERVGNAPKPDWYHDGFSLVQDTPYTFLSPADLQTDASCAPNRGGPAAQMLLINHWIEKQTPLQEEAATVNAYDFLLNRVQRCQQSRGLFPNIIAVDFAEKGDLLRVVNTINGVGDAKPQSPPSIRGTPTPTPIP